MIVNTRTGEIHERPPRRSWDTRRIAASHQRYLLLVDLVIALAVYAFGSTVVIALLV